MRLSWFVLALPLFLIACATSWVSDSEKDFRNNTVLITAGGGWGSGAFISKDTILTAAHVAEMATEFEIIMADGTKRVAHRGWTSPDLDAATLVIEGEPSKFSAPIDCKPLEWGEPFSWIGNPSILRWNLMRGYISGDEIKNPDTGEGLHAYPAAALFNPGDSGSAIFDDDGYIRGIAVGFIVARLGFVPSQSGNGVVVAASAFCKDIVS